MSALGGKLPFDWDGANATLAGCKYSKPPVQNSVSGKIIKADLSLDEFQQEWRRISLPLRALLFVLAPIIGLKRRLFATRETLGQKMSLEDRKSADEILSWSPSMDPFHHSVLHARDERLLECLGAELDTTDAKRVAVVYGAMHIRSVIRELSKRGFYCSEASWRTIFAF